MTRRRRPISPTVCAVLFLASVSLADPQPGTPGSSGDKNPHGSPPGQGGVIPGNSGDKNPHGSPPGQRIESTQPPVVVPAAGSPPAPTAPSPGGSVSGSRVGSPLVGELHPAPPRATIPPWPPQKPPPGWEMVRARLGPDLAPYGEAEFDVTMVTLGSFPGEPYQRSVSRHRRKGGVERLELLEPVRLVQVARDGKVSAWAQGTGWVEMEVGSNGSLPGAGSAPADSEPELRPPRVAWGIMPRQVVVTFTRLHETEELVVDWDRKVRMRQRWLRPDGTLKREDVWEEERVRGIRRPLRLHHAEHVALVAPYTVSWEWQAGVSGLSADELAVAP